LNVINIKLFISFLLFAAGLVGFYVLLDEPVVFRILSVLVGVVASLFVFWTTPLGQQAIGFFKRSSN
jgi:preprotein translocase subunit SecE